MDIEIEEDELGHTVWRPKKELIEQAAKSRHPSPIAKSRKEGLEKMSHQEKLGYIATRFGEIMEVLGLDLTDPSLARTPLRVAKMYLDEVFAGLDSKNFPPITLLPYKRNGLGPGNPIFVKSTFTSFCEHHFVPMNGVAYVSYCPQDTLIGLSKIPRIIRYFASQPQLQERLTEQIADAVSIVLDTSDVAVSLSAQHFCVVARGVENSSSHATTTVLRGRYEKEAQLRQEFFEAINRPLPS
jgi:GTP cyclohydrolase I